MPGAGQNPNFLQSLYKALLEILFGLQCVFDLRRHTERELNDK